MVETVSKFFVGVLVLAAIASVVRPQSQAPGIIKNTLGGLTGLVNAASH